MAFPLKEKALQCKAIYLCAVINISRTSKLGITIQYWWVLNYFTYQYFSNSCPACRHVFSMCTLVNTLVAFKNRIVLIRSNGKPNFSQYQFYSVFCRGSKSIKYWKYLKKLSNLHKGDVSTNHKSSNRIILSQNVRSRFIQVLVTWHDPTLQPTHPPKHLSTWTHPNPQTELNYLDKFEIYSIFSFSTWPYPSTYPSIHPPKDGGVSTDYKPLNRIELFWLVLDLFHF